MKRIIALILCLCLLFSLSACTSKPKTIVGTWECTNVSEMAGLMMGVAGDLSGMGFLGDLGSNIDVSIELTFKPDGTYQMDMAASMMFIGTETETTSGTYSWSNDVLIMDGEVTDFKLRGDKLTISEKTEDGYVLRLEFKRVD